MSETILEVNNLNKTFLINKSKGPIEFLRKIRSNRNVQVIKALDNISFSVSKGEVLGIIGLNGSGKSTLLQVIAGIYQPDSGNIKVNGVIAPILHIGTGFQPELIPSENIIIYGMLMGFAKKDIKNKIDNILEFAELKEFSNMRLKHFSTGMRARLAFSTMLQMNPDILLIDEILSVGDVKFKKKSYEAFSKFKAQGKTILVATHSLTTLPNLCDRAILIHKGKMIFVGTPDEAIKKYQEIVKQKN